MSMRTTNCLHSHRRRAIGVALAFALGAFVSGAGAAETSAEPRADWYPSRFGAQDRLGAANFLSPEIVRRAAGLVTEGRAYALGMVVSAETPGYPPRRFDIMITQPSDGTGTPVGENQATGNDEMLIASMGLGSHLDGLGHLGIGHRYYNGLHASAFVDPTGLKELGTENIPPLVTRGVLLDMAALEGVKTVPAGRAFNRAEIEAAARRQGLELRRGDVVLFHSGWGRVLERDRDRWWQTHPGIGVGGARYLAELGVVAVGADTAAVEVIPFENEARPFEPHQILLAQNGVYLLENMKTDALAADAVHEFLFVLGQPRFKGASQVAVNPIAIR